MAARGATPELDPPLANGPDAASAGGPPRRSRAAWLAAAALMLPAFLWLALEGKAYPAFETHQVGDYAKIELYTLLATEGSQRVGAESRFHLHQPGPMFFYAAAPFYALLGGTTTGMAAAALVWNTVFVVLLLLSAHRLAPGTGPLLAALLLGAFLQARGLGFLLSPWNPHVCMLPFGLVLLAGARLATGEGRALALLALASIAVVQCQMAWGLPVVLVVGTAVLLSLWPAARRGMRIPTAEWGLRWRHVAAATLVSCVLWALPVVDELVGEYRNLHRIVAMSQRPRPPKPWSATVAPSVTALSLRRDGWPSADARELGSRDDLDPRWWVSPAAGIAARDLAWTGLVVTSVLLAGGLAWRRRSPIAALALVTAIALVSLPLVARFVPGKQMPPYVFQWGAMVTLLALLGAGTELLARRPRLQPLAGGWPGLTALLLVPLLLLSGAVRGQERRSASRDPRSVAVEKVTRTISDRVRAEIPPGRRFLVRVAPGAQQDTVIGLILALDKEGLGFGVERFGSCRIEGRFTPRGDEWGELLVGDLPSRAGAMKLGELGRMSIVWQASWRKQIARTPPGPGPALTGRGDRSGRKVESRMVV